MLACWSAAEHSTTTLGVAAMAAAAVVVTAAASAEAAEVEKPASRVAELWSTLVVGQVSCPTVVPLGLLCACLPVLRCACCAYCAALADRLDCMQRVRIVRHSDCEAGAEGVVRDMAHGYMQIELLAGRCEGQMMQCRRHQIEWDDKLDIPPPQMRQKLSNGAPDDATQSSNAIPPEAYGASMLRSPVVPGPALSV